VAGQFMANVDIAIVNVTTPSIHRELHASGGALEFVALPPSSAGWRPVVAAVAGVAAYGTVYFALDARPGFAFAVVTAALAASGFAGAACSLLSVRRRAAEVPTARDAERVPARLGR
jgi:hypothetical protein